MLRSEAEPATTLVGTSPEPFLAPGVMVQKRPDRSAQTRKAEFRGMFRAAHSWYQKEPRVGEPPPELSVQLMPTMAQWTGARNTGKRLQAFREGNHGSGCQRLPKNSLLTPIGPDWCLLAKGRRKQVPAFVYAGFVGV